MHMLHIIVASQRVLKGKLTVCPPLPTKIVEKYGTVGVRIIQLSFGGHILMSTLVSFPGSLDGKGGV